MTIPEEAPVPGKDEIADMLEALSEHVRAGRIHHFEVKWMTGGNATLTACLFEPSSQFLRRERDAG